MIYLDFHASARGSNKLESRDRWIPPQPSALCVEGLRIYRQIAAWRLAQEFQECGRRERMCRGVLGE